MFKIEKDTPIGALVELAPQVIPIFYAIGMHCLGCEASMDETVEEACYVHGIDVDKLLVILNQEANRQEEE